MGDRPMLKAWFIPQPKPKPYLLVKRERKSKKDAKDARERKKCHARSGGRCEVVEVVALPEQSELKIFRCKKAARQNHHLLSGVGRRNVGDSILAEHRLDVCTLHHSEITNKVIVPCDLDKAKHAATVTYWRDVWRDL